MKLYRFYDIHGKYKPGIYDNNSNAPGSGCDIHAGWSNMKKLTSESSTGCLVIRTADRDDGEVQDYRNFMDAIGMKDVPFTTDPYFDDPDPKKKKSIPLPVITGAVVVDRSLADPDYLKEMYTIDEAVNTIMGR